MISLATIHVVPVPLVATALTVRKFSPLVLSSDVVSNFEEVQAE